MIVEPKTSSVPAAAAADATPGAAARVVENPFLILGVAPTTPRMEIEREAQKLLGMLELGLALAATYQTPLGPRTRTAELVRAAVATLRDPTKRLAAELWARGGGGVGGGGGASGGGGGGGGDGDGDGGGLEDGLARLGWRRK